MLLFRPFSGQSCSCASALCDCFGDRGFDSLRLSITSVRTGGFHTHQKKPLGRLQHSLVNLARSMWQQTMKRSEEHTSELQSQSNLVCRLLLEKKKEQNKIARLF